MRDDVKSTSSNLRSSPYLPELHVPDKHGIGIGNCDDKTGQTVHEASFQHIDFQELEKWAKKKKRKMKPFPRSYISLASRVEKLFTVLN